MIYAFRQVEFPASWDNNGWSPPADVVPGVTIENTSPSVTLQPGQHATAVAVLLAGSQSPAHGVCTKIMIHDHSCFIGASGLGESRYWIPSDTYPTNPFPKQLPHDGEAGTIIVINASYGEAIVGPNPDFPGQDVFTRLKQYLDRNNQVMVAALPDLGMSTDLQFPGASADVIAVGSSNYGHEAPNGRLPDVVVPDYTSYGSPRVAAAAIVLIKKFIDAGLSYTRGDIKKLIMDGATALTNCPWPSGAGLLNLTKSIALWDARYGTDSMPNYNLTYARAVMSAGLDVPANAFTPIVLTSVENPGGNWNDSTGRYVVPATGRYQITLHARPSDTALENISWGLGADTAEQDGPAFFWVTTNKHADGMTYTRNGAINLIERTFNAGDQIRMFVYASGVTLHFNAAEIVVKQVG